MVRTKESACCKVGRVIDEYALEGLDDRLQFRWTDESINASTRELATYLNEHILETAMLEHGMTPMPGQVETTYRYLADDDQSAVDRREIGDRLAGEGIDVDILRDTFVSHQTVYRHLTGCLDLEAPSKSRRGGSSPSPVDIGALRGRTRAVIESALTSSSRNGTIDHDEYDVFVDITVSCPACATRYDLDELLDRGGCGCDA